MMQQYAAIKKQHRDAILFFRLGDFYEMFLEDAAEASKLLGLTLTKRNGVQMCGIPYHSSQNYTQRLLRAGKKIAICEQVKLPEGGKGIAQREVVEVLTPGTILDTDMLDSSSNNFLLSCYAEAALLETGLGQLYSAAIDISTGELFLSRQQLGVDRIPAALRDELSRWAAKEIIVQDGLLEHFPELASQLSASGSVVVNRYPDWTFAAAQAFDELRELLKLASLKAFGIVDAAADLAPVGPILEYAQANLRKRPDFICRISLLGSEDVLKIDENSARNLELFENLREGGSKYSLLGVISRTLTGMGGRLLRQRLLRPLTSLARINERLEQAFDLAEFPEDLRELRQALAKISDIERLCARISMDKAHARDLQALALSGLELGALPTRLKSEKLRKLCAGLLTKNELELANQAFAAILENPSILLTEGKLFAAGYNEELDRLRSLKEDSRAVLSSMLEKERERTGIQNLRVRYNRIIGYHFEVSRGQTTKVPEHFIRRQSLVNAERFSTEELGALEVEMNESSEKVVDLERDLFLKLREKFKAALDGWMACAELVAQLDCAAAAAELVIQDAWVRPELIEDPIIDISEGRHPVVAAGGPRGAFIPNNLELSASDNSKACALITGPNMAGKSTYLRQNALIVILAQMGFPVPAQSARIGICDQLFCRVGASDNLARGESTFLVEMSETALILRTATRQSFLILDEVGRGTSTQDGLAIAQSVLEHLANVLGARTLFATHYHELTELPLPGMKNLCLSVREEGDSVTFLRRVIPGASDSSYGIHVAQIAGVPRSVIQRAFEVLRERAVLSPGPAASAPVPETASPRAEQSLFDAADEILMDLKNIDPAIITPLQALVHITRWREALEAGRQKGK